MKFGTEKIGSNEAQKEINNFSIVKTCRKKAFGFIDNNCVDNCVFSNGLKNCEVTPIHKTKDKSDKTSYRPVSKLPNISKSI